MAAGNPKVDAQFEFTINKFCGAVVTFKKGAGPRILNNLDQKSLRNNLHRLRKSISILKDVEADMAKYLDVRNEQGRGALMKAKKK